MNYRIKEWLYPKLASVLLAFGTSPEKICKSRLSFYTLIAQATKIAQGISLREEKKDKQVFFLTLLGGSRYVLCTELVLAWGLKARGYKVTFILDDGQMEINELTKNGEETKWKSINTKSFSFGSRLISSAGFKYLPVSSFLVSQSFDYDEKYDSIVEAGLLKHYRVGILSNDLPNLSKKKEILKKVAMISAAVGKALSEFKPHAVVMSHGIYPTWGAAFDVLISSKTPVLTYGRGKKRSTLKFNWNSTADWWDVSSEWGKVKDIPLKEHQTLLIDDYLKSRVSHKNDALVYNFGQLENKETTYARFGLSSEKPVYSLFTNVLWDAASAQREIVFSNPLEWVIETIKWFNQHPEKQLIVKIHPAEVVIGTNQPFYDLIHQSISKINNNVKIIRPDENVNSWSIYEVTDLGIVHTTTAGMELPLVGKPCIVVSKTHFRERGFTVDISSKEEYFNTLLNFNSANVNNREELKRLSKRYAYLLFERYQLPFGVFFEMAPGDVRCFSASKYEDFLDRAALDTILDGLEEYKTILIDRNSSKN